MTLDDEKRIVDSARRCQRNWDLSKSILQEHIEHWIYIATHSPSKQDESYYNIYVLTNKDLIAELLDHTWGFSFPIRPGDFRGVARNTQMGANAYIIFTIKRPGTVREIYPDGTPYDKNSHVRVENACTAAGIAGGIIAYSANRLGYKTGYNRNHTELDVWYEKLNIPQDEKIIFGLGIGYPQEGRERNETDETVFHVGYPGTVHSTKDPYIEVDGEKLPTPPIRYKTFSEIPKTIHVFRFE